VIGGRDGTDIGRRDARDCKSMLKIEQMHDEMEARKVSKLKIPAIMGGGCYLQKSRVKQNKCRGKVRLVTGPK